MIFIILMFIWPHLWPVWLVLLLLQANKEGS